MVGKLETHKCTHTGKTFQCHAGTEGCADDSRLHCSLPAPPSPKPDQVCCESYMITAKGITNPTYRITDRATCKAPSAPGGGKRIVDHSLCEKPISCNMSVHPARTCPPPLQCVRPAGAAKGADGVCKPPSTPKPSPVGTLEKHFCTRTVKQPFMCVAGTKGCVDNSPQFCTKESDRPGSPHLIQCSGGASVVCPRGAKGCYDNSPVFCKKPPSPGGKTMKPVFPTKPPSPGGKTMKPVFPTKPPSPGGKTMKPIVPTKPPSPGGKTMKPIVPTKPPSFKVECTVVEE